MRMMDYHSQASAGAGEEEIDVTRSLSVKELPMIVHLKERLTYLFEEMGFKPTKVTVHFNVGHVSDFAFMEFPNTEIANMAMGVMDGAMFWGNVIKVTRLDVENTSDNDIVPCEVGRQTR